MQKIVNICIMIAIIALAILVIWNSYDIKQIKHNGVQQWISTQED